MRTRWAGVMVVVLVAGVAQSCGRSHRTTPPAAPASSVATTSSSSTTPTSLAPGGPAPGGPVPAGFAPVSVSFVSADEGFVLGSARCASPPCTSLARTTDGGRSWAGVPAPRAALASAVSKVRFADPMDGWVFGPALWVTHDGARSWQMVSLPGEVVDLAATGDVAYAVVTSCTSRPCSAPTRLFRSSTTGDAWTPVAGVAGAGWGQAGAPLAFHGRAGYAALGTGAGMATALFATGDGTNWHQVPDPCSTQQPAGWWMSAVAAADDTVVFELCQGSPGAGQAPQRVYRAADRGATPAPVGPARLGPDNLLLTAASPQVLVEGQWSGATFLEVSTDGGRSFGRASATLPSGGVPLSDLGFTTSTQGAVVFGGPQPSGIPDELLVTRDGGATWAAVAIR